MGFRPSIFNPQEDNPMKHVKSSRRRSAAALLASASVAAALLASAAPLAVVSPRDGAVVPTLSDGQKAFLSMPRKERVAYFASKECRRKMVGLGWYPKPVRLEWRVTAACGRREK